MDDDRGLWIDEGPAESSATASRKSGSRTRTRASLVLAAIVCIAVVGVPVGLVVAGHGPAHHGTASGKGGAEHRVLSALSATTDAGSFDFTYNLSSTPATQPPVANNATTTTTTAAIPSSCVAPSCNEYEPATAIVTGPNVSGSGTIDTNPFGMVATASIGDANDSSGTDSSDLQVTVRVDSTTLYEGGSDTGGLAPPADDATATGQSIDGFAGITEGTLGAREGAIAMLGLSSPTGYLDLDQASITSASQVGTSTLGGVPVTDYQVTSDPSQLIGSPAVSPEESDTIAAAIGVLQANGYTGTSVNLSIDASGFIRQVTSVASFSDGSTVTIQATFSDFGCAGTVLMPGQTGSGSPPANCTSADSSPQTTPAVTTQTVPTTTEQTEVPLTTPTTTVVSPPATPSTTTSTTT